MKPKLLDLFAGAGGAGVGYARAGFDVTAVDIEPHPDSPHPVIVADALQVLTETAFLEGFDVIHASPPCQGYTTMSNRWRGAGGAADAHPDLISWVRLGLEAWGGAYVIENVGGAKKELRNPITLRGGHFGLGVDRPRLFESNVPLAVPAHTRVDNPLGVYGKHHDGRRLFTRADGSIQRAAKSLEEARAAMGIDWMNWDDLRESVPPAYTEWIGSQLLEPDARARRAPVAVDLIRESTTQILGLHEEGHTVSEIAEALGMAESQVYRRFHRAGMSARQDNKARFWRKVEKTETCWLWTGEKNNQGYGRFRLGGVKQQAHRIAYEWLVGPIPDGYPLDHLCRVPACVRPDHLEPVTSAENTRRGLNGVLRTACRGGHPLTPENTVPGKGIRQCMTCQRRKRAAETAVAR